jgi:hypothetical protein
MVRGMPVARGEQRNAGSACSVYPSIKDRNDLIAAVDGERTSWAEVVLDVNDEKGITAL